MAASPKLGIRAGGDRHAPGESWLSSAPLAHSQGAAEAPLRICNFSRCLERRGRRKAHIREGELERRATIPILRAAVTTYSEPRAQRTVPLPSTTDPRSRGVDQLRPCVRASVVWYALHNIVFPKTSRLSQKNIKKEERTRISSRCRCCIFTPLRSRSLLLLRAARTFSFLISAGAALRNPFLPSFSPAVPSFFYLMALRSVTPDFQERGTEQLTT